MDADRFDSLAKRLVTPTTRRATLGASMAGGLLGALGLGRVLPETHAAQGGTCTLDFSATVRLGPSQSQPLAASGQPGALRGELSFGLEQSGRLQNGLLQLPGGQSFPVVGQAMGHSLQLRIELAPRLALVAVGVGEQQISRCQGAIDGMTSGPDVGDLGDWHAVGVQQARGGNQSGSGSSSGSGGSESGSGASNASSGGSSGTTGEACPQGQTYCDGIDECTDLRTDALNCGACRNKCSSVFCRDGRCLSDEEADRLDGVVCQEGFDFCDTETGGRLCADLSQNSLNCGTCGFACPADRPLCQNSECVADGGGCPEGQTRCGDACVDLQTNSSHCGECGKACPAGQSCNFAQCGGVPCPGATECGGECVDILTNSNHCGNCGIACEVGTTCQDGECIVAGGGGCKDGSLTYCGEVAGCVDLNIDPAHCGDCGVACAAGEICQSRACTATTTEAPPALDCAAQGLTDCGGECVNVQTNPNHCGNCGGICPSGQCIGGICLEVGEPGQLRGGVHRRLL